MSNTFDIWQSCLDKKRHPRILATGTKLQPGSPEQIFSDFYPDGIWEGTDIEAGDGVDIVCDLEKLDENIPYLYDAIFSPATLEHVPRPWRAMDAMYKSLKSKGVLYLQTHQTFPIHGYPSDYFRFTTEALSVMATDSGFRILAAEYEFPCQIVPPPEVTRWNTAAESFLNVIIVAVKDG